MEQKGQFLLMFWVSFFTNFSPFWRIFREFPRKLNSWGVGVSALSGISAVVGVTAVYCDIAVACVPVVASINAVAGVPLVPDVLTWWPPVSFCWSHCCWPLCYCSPPMVLLVFLMLLSSLVLLASLLILESLFSLVPLRSVLYNVTYDITMGFFGLRLSDCNF